MTSQSFCMTLSDTVDDDIKNMASLTGWTWKGGDKDLSYGVSFRGHGVVVHMEQALQIHNTRARIADVTTTINKVVRADTLRPAVAAQLVRRLSFSAAQLFGRTGAAVIKCGNSVGERKERLLSRELVRCLNRQVLMRYPWLAPRHV